LHIHHFKRATRHLLLWGLIAAAIGLSAVRIFLADVPAYKTELEQKIRQITHIPIHIGKLNTRMRFFSPGIVLQDISIDAANPDAAPAIELKEIRISVDLLNMLWTVDPWAATKITLVGAKFDVVRNLDGVIAIKGLESGNEQPLWLLQGNKYEILQSQVNWQDLKNNDKQINFRNFDLLLKNREQSHEIHLLTSLPEQYGNTLRISAQLQGNIFDANHLNGQVYIEGVNLQGPALANGESLLGYKIESGSGDIRVWSRWQNTSPIRLAGYVQAQQIKIADSKGKSLQMDTIEGNLSYLLKPDGWRLGAYDIDIVANRQRWSNAEFYLQQNTQGAWSGLIKQFDLQALTHLAPLFLPAEKLPADWAQLNLGGQLNNLAFYTQADLSHYAINGGFSQLSSNAANSIPKITEISGHISGNDTQGRIDFASKNVKIEALEFFRNSLTVQSINGGIDWRQQQDDWQFSSRGLAVDTPDFQTETDFDLNIPKNKTSPDIDLLVRFGNMADLSKLPLYYPTKVMDKDAVKWLDQAFVSGRINQGEMVLKGRLDQFPFDNGQGIFETIFSVENGELQYHPDWPTIRDINADFHYLGKDLRVAIGSGHSENVDIKQLLVTINSLPISERAQINGQLQSGLQNALQFLQKTPLHFQADPLAKLVNLESNTQIDLDLNIPFHDHMPFGVNVDAHVNNARLLFKPINLPFKQINGILHFTENSISSNQLTAVALGSPIKGVLSTDNTAIHLQVDGVTDTDALQQQFAFLHNDISHGAFGYQANLTVPHAPNQPQLLNITSNLQGLGIDSEDFLSKTIDEKRLLKLDFLFDNKPLLPVHLYFGSDLNAALLVNTEKNYLFSGHIVAGKEEADFRQQEGLSVEIRQPEFKLSQAIGVAGNGDSKLPTLQEVLLETDNLIWQGRNLGPVNGHFRHDNQVWQGNIDSSMAKGRIIVPDLKISDNPIKLDMDYLNLSAMSSLNFDAAEETIDTLPLIDIDSQQLLWRSVNLGKLKLQTERRNNGIHFKQIKISGANKDIHFNADWIKLAHGSSTLISGTLSMDGFGQFLSEMGYSDDFKETRAELSFTGGWSDTPQQFSLPRLHGQLQVMLSDGRISSIEPGFGRLLGLISMEQWAKRLSLDFSDIYRQGLAFNKITGDINISGGIASSNNLLIDAVAAKMKITGTANLLDKTLNHRVIVIPKSSDALPIAGTIVGGVAAFITNAVTDDYTEGYFFGSEYKISGHWGNVEVTPVTDHNGLVNKTWQGLTDFGWLIKNKE